MTTLHQNVIPCPAQWQAQQKRHQREDRFQQFLLALDGIVNLTLGVCTIIGTVAFLGFCFG